MKDVDANVNVEEFSNLFCKEEIKRQSSKNSQDPKNQLPISPKNLMMIEILEKHLRIDFPQLEIAIYNLDTKILTHEFLSQIYKFVSSSIYFIFI